MPQMNARQPLYFNDFQFPNKQDEYIKQLASKVDVLTTYNKMLEAQIAQ